jgi:DivIVA domain-containing protein
VTWFFAILIVLAMGGVAVLAAGKGAPLAEEYDDRPDAAVPANGPLRADDLRRVRFSLALRGYRMSEVDALLDRLASQLEQQDEHAVDSEGRGDDASP